MPWEFLKLISIDVGIAILVGLIISGLTKDRTEKWLGFVAVLGVVAISVGVEVLVWEHETQVKIAELHESPYDLVLKKADIAGRTIAKKLNDARQWQLSTLANGHLQIDAKDEPICSLPVDAIQSANRTVLATAMVDPEGFWTAFCGQTYLDANREALARRVKITRVFLLSVDSVKKYRFTIQKNLDLRGIEVRVACLPEMQQMGFGEDFGIFDDDYAVFLDTWPTGTVRGLRCIFRDSDEDRDLRKTTAVWTHIYENSSVVSSFSQASDLINQTCK